MNLLLLLVVYALVEAAWLFAMRPFYASRFAKFTIDRVLSVRSWPAVALIYPLLLGAFYLLVLRARDLVVARGAVFGAAVYGVYNLTNKATLPGYPWCLVAVDTLWGTAVFAGLAALASRSRRRWYKGEPHV